MSITKSLDEEETQADSDTEAEECECDKCKVVSILGPHSDKEETHADSDTEAEECECDKNGWIIGERNTGGNPCPDVSN